MGECSDGFKSKNVLREVRWQELQEGCKGKEKHLCTII